MSDFKSGTLSFEGGKQLEQALKEIEGKLANKIGRKAVRETIKPVHAQIKAAAPVKTGVLKAGIIIKTRKRKGRLTASVVASDKFWKPEKATSGSGKKAKTRQLFYANFIELGTAHQAASPFMRPAFDSNRESMVSGVTKRLREGIDQAAKQAPKGKK